MYYDDHWDWNPWPPTCPDLCCDWWCGDQDWLAWENEFDDDD